MPPDITVLDIIAIVWFFVCWLGISWIGSHFQSQDKLTLSGLSRNYRVEWMTRMLERENRIVDASLIGSLMRSVSFFASTSILILASLITLLGIIEQAVTLFEDVPFASHVSVGFWKIKVLILVTLFVYSFFKMVWSLRQFNTSIIMMGAMPNTLRIGCTD